MLDRNSELVLKKIKQLCEDGKYKVITLEDLQVFGKGEDADYEVVLEIINFLVERNFIELKYKDDDSFCLTVLSKGRLYEEEVTAKESEKKSYSKLVKISFYGSLLGGFAGVLLAMGVIEIIKAIF